MAISKSTENCTLNPLILKELKTPCVQVIYMYMHIPRTNAAECNYLSRYYT